MTELMLYIHIPFCEQKCDYCDFLSAQSTQEERQDYVETLCKELKLHSKLGTEVTITSIFFGGGTPSILTETQIIAIMGTIEEVFQNISPTAEISLELNPGTATLEKLRTYKAQGINRLSIGLQATNDEELRTLGCIHTYQVFLDTYHMAREVGFENINVDLMSAIPGQNLATWEESLCKIIELAPEHISAYSLIIEEDTPYYKSYGEDKPKSHKLPSESEERLMYHKTKEILKEAGYDRYEVSNYGKKGYECKHNLGYWNREAYLGLGLGAASLLKDTEEVRTTNYKDYEDYKHRIIHGEIPVCEQEILSKQESMEEFMFLGLRKSQGVDVTVFQTIYGCSLESVYGDVLDTLLKKNLIQYKGNHIRLTDQGVDLSNVVLSEFI